MPVEAIQALSSRSRLMQALIEEQRHQQQQILTRQQDEFERRKSASTSPAMRSSLPNYDKQGRDGGFELSTNHVYRLMQRYGLENFNFQQLQSIPMSELSAEEKGFVLYLQRNKAIFDRFAALDRQPGTISMEDVRLASQLSGDSMTLTSNDLNYIRTRFPGEDRARRLEQSASRQRDLAASSQAAADARSVAARTPAPPPSIREMESLLRRIAEGLQAGMSTRTDFRDASAVYPTTPAVSGGLPLITYDQLMRLRPEELGLTPVEQQRLDFLRSPAIAAMLSRIAQDNNNNRFITVDVLRIMSSLIFNPMIYGNVPITFFRPLATSRFAPDEEIHATEASEEVLDVLEELPDPMVRGRYRLMASDIIAICHHLSEDGTVSLKQLRAYKPANAREAKALNLLRQNSIFHRLADLDHHGDTLSDEDIRLAVAEKALVMSDSAMVLVILP